MNSFKLPTGLIAASLATQIIAKPGENHLHSHIEAVTPMFNFNQGMSAYGIIRRPSVSYGSLQVKFPTLGFVDPVVILKDLE